MAAEGVTADFDCAQIYGNAALNRRECHEEEPASHRLTCLGRLAPGPDYKLYLSPEFVETEADFARLKGRMMRVGDVKTFDNFVVRVPESVDISRYNTVIVWCESFGQFITAAKYR